MTTTDRAPTANPWPQGEVPFEIPAVWAAHTALLARVDDAVALVNAALQGYATIRSRRPGDRDYLVLHVTTRARCEGSGAAERSMSAAELLDPGPGCRGGPQKLHCEVASLTCDQAPDVGALVAEFCAALGVRASAADQQPTNGRPAQQLGNSLHSCVVEALRLLYPVPDVAA